MSTAYLAYEAVDGASSLRGWKLQGDAPNTGATGGESVYHGEREYPGWVKPIVERLVELWTMAPDPRGGTPLNRDDLCSAMGFLNRVMVLPDMPVPWIGRLSTGGLQLTWTGTAAEVEAVFDRSRSEQTVIIEDSGSEIEVSPDYAVPHLLPLISRLGHG